MILRTFIPKLNAQYIIYIIGRQMDQTVIFEAAESFSVPTAIVDNHIDAPQNALRLILFLLRNKNMSYLTSEICEKLALTGDEVAEAFEYWEKAGLLFKYGGRYRLERPKVQPSDIIRYSPTTVADRMDADPAIAYLYKKTEQAFAKPLSADDAAAVLSLTDWIGLKPDVAALLIDHVAAQGVRSMKKLLSTAAQWEELGLDSFEKADEYVTEQNRKRSVEAKTASLLGITGRRITPEESEYFNKWNDEYGFKSDMILEAYNRTVRGTGKFAIKYMERILSGWHESGYKKPEDIADEAPDAAKTYQKKPAKKNKQKIDAEAAKAASWDIILGDSDKEDDSDE